MMWKFNINYPLHLKNDVSNNKYVDAVKEKKINDHVLLEYPCILRPIFNSNYRCNSKLII